MPTHGFRLGDKVKVQDGRNRFPGVWTVIKVNPKTLGLDQNGKKLRAHPSFCSAASAMDVKVAEASPRLTLYLGNVVQWQNKDGYYVVLKDNGDTVHLVLLGGEDGGRYYTKVRLSLLKKVDLGAMGQSLVSQADVSTDEAITGLRNLLGDWQ